MKPSILHAILVLVLVALVSGCADLGPDGDSVAAGSGQGGADAAGDATVVDGSTHDTFDTFDTFVACDGTAVQCAAAAEQRAADRLDDVVGDPVALAAFMTAVPKGGDLHMHLSGAVYAETYLLWANEEGGYCISKYSLALTTSCSNSNKSYPLPAPGDDLYDEVVSAWSMQGFVPGDETGEHHFFSTFGKFGAMSGSAHHAMGLADVMKRADSENVVYIEPMLYSNYTATVEGSKVWTGGALKEKDFASFHAALLSDSAWSASTQAIVNDIEKTEAGARLKLGCDGRAPLSPCRVGVRFMVYISRSGSGPKVFAQMVAAFEAAMVEPRLVALNLVGPEDSIGALKPYDRQMAMLGYLHTAYAGKSPLHISLHAGELVAQYLPSGYTIPAINHIRKAVEVAHAERIGHGVDVMGETNPGELLAELKKLGVLIEIGLSSNIQILKVSGAKHPLATYLANGVAVALATDDQGVSRSSMAGEYTRAVIDQKLDYRTLKRMARTSLEKSFLQGDSLWVALDPPQAVTACTPTPTSTYGDKSAPAACQDYLDGSDKAATQWALEHRFQVFEEAQ